MRGIIASAGVTLTRPMSRPVVLTSFRPVCLPIHRNGAFISRCTSSASGMLPSMTMPMAQTVSIASVSGVRLPSGQKPVMYCTAPSIRPRLASTCTPLANTLNPRTTAPGALTRPMNSAAEISRMGNV